MLEELSPQKLIEACQGAWQRAYGGSIEVEYLTDRYCIGNIQADLMGSTVSIPPVQPSYKASEFMEFISVLSAK